MSLIIFTKQNSRELGEYSVTAERVLAWITAGWNLERIQLWAIVFPVQ